MSALQGASRRAETVTLGLMRHRRHSCLLRAIRGSGVATAVAIVMISALATACGGDTGSEVSGTTSTSGVSSEGTSTVPAPPVPAPSAPSTTGAGAPTEHSTVLLRPDGLGVTAFGDMPEYAIAALTAELGEPTRDKTEPAFSSFGTCPGTTLRAVEWGGLAVLITDGATAYGIEGGPHFFAYQYRSDESLGLVTREGVGLGSTVADLRAAYGAEVRVSSEQYAPADPAAASFEVGAYGPAGLYGFLDGTADTSTVTEIAAGQACGE